MRHIFFHTTTTCCSKSYARKWWGIFCEHTAVESKKSNLTQTWDKRHLKVLRKEAVVTDSPCTISIFHADQQTTININTNFHSRSTYTCKYIMHIVLYKLTLINWFTKILNITTAMAWRAFGNISKCSNYQTANASVLTAKIRMGKYWTLNKDFIRQINTLCSGKRHFCFLAKLLEKETNLNENFRQNN